MDEKKNPLLRMHSTLQNTNVNVHYYYILVGRMNWTDQIERIQALL